MTPPFVNLARSFEIYDEDDYDNDMGNVASYPDSTGFLNTASSINFETHLPPRSHSFDSFQDVLDAAASVEDDISESFEESRNEIARAYRDGRHQFLA
jgi:hypothetical protein